ncbi:PRTRC system protein C [Alistipes sp. OttesenSCG-928-L06]|nr:PRTRC system protein C [Alistipes sp. OttesenSCG-928-L06]
MNTTFEVTGLDREFRFKQDGQDVTLPDPDPERTPEQVMALYAATYPFLTTATVHGPVTEGDKVVYEFKTVLGTKG